jgi:cytochrome c oxidase subunit 4
MRRGDTGTEGGAGARQGLSPRAAVAVAAALLALLALTAWTAEIDLGPFNLVAALGIAALKAALVALFFMELRRASPLTWLVAGAGLFWLAIMMTLTLADTVHRAPLPFPLH